MTSTRSTQKRWARDGHKRIAPLLPPAANNLLAMYPVSPYVNKPANEGPECIAPLEEDTGLFPGE